MALRPKNWTTTHLHPPVEQKQDLEEYWWEGGSSTGSIEEEHIGSSEYDVGTLDLGAESPRSGSSTNLVENTAYVKQWAEAGIAVPRVPVRHSLWRSSSFGKGLNRLGSAKKELDDRDCGICFEYAVVPCRTLCCGKIFCTEHLADWLHGPNAEGRCPNCENACSLEGGTLSLAPPVRLPSSQTPSSKRIALTPANHGAYHPSPLAVAQQHSNDTLKGTRDRSRSPPKDASGSVNVDPSSCSTSSTSTVVSSDRTPSSDEDARHLLIHRHHHHGGGFSQLVGPSPSTINLSTTPFSASWGAVSRLMSIITFLMFLYKLLS